MASRRNNNHPSQDLGDYVMRGGERIELERESDRFTAMPADARELERLRSAPGVRAVEPVTREVYRVLTTMNERDAAMSALRSDAFNTIAHHAYRPKDGEGTVFYITDRIVMRLAKSATQADMSVLLDKYKLRLLKAYERRPQTYLVQVTKDSGANPIKIANLLAREKGLVEYAEPDMINRFYSSQIPSDPLFKRQWHLDAKAGPQLLAAAAVGAPAAWDITPGERSIVVAVIDDGFDLSHPDFQGAGKVVHPRDYVDGDSTPFPEASHDDYHGTPCAGVAIAESNGRGVVGVAMGCAFMPVRFPLSASDDELVQIFEETAAHADVISCSWGPPPVNAPLPQVLSDTFTELATSGGPRGNGVVICFAAANFNAPLNADVGFAGFVWRDYDGQLRRTRGRILNGNATHPSLIAVAASTSLNRHAAYSNWGKEVCVCAPSNNFNPLDSSAFAPGLGIWTTDNERHGQDFTPRSRYTGRFGGTSSATPLVAGIAALVLSANPNLSAAEVKEILQSTADKIVDTDPDFLGAMRGAYDGNGHSDWFGFGKVNAEKAVREAKRRG
ncbi:S8 family serine peptidase [Azotobacter chroococcum]|uniref:S8 family serine peptidase n=1 Tax=Azotobacter chroococcum TaxID=353 RepID=UPI0010AE9872|nr:S8 family serine peptidase [Azotobacter chroococcum]TKD47384.1 peptidase S8 [Azotobacter chroococcum]